MGIRVFVLEDHQLVREALVTFLTNEPEFEVAGATASAAEALASIPSAPPDVAVLDQGLPDGTGIEVCREIRSVAPSVRCLILTGLSDRKLMGEAILAGAAGYVTKDTGLHDLGDIIKRIHEGESMVDPRAAAELVESIRLESEGGEKGRLTPQESRTLELIAEGLTNREIAERLQLAEQTVKNYVSSILSKLGFERRTQAALYASRRTQSN